MKATFVTVVSIFVFCAQIWLPASALALDKGWWVVIASMPADEPGRMKSDFERMSAAALRCGFTAFNDFSSKFKGFQPGYNVFVVGAYASRAQADGARASLDRCAPNSYVKYGQYLGE